MKRYEFPYAKGAETIELEEAFVKEDLKSNQVELPRRTVEEHIRYALKNPIDSPVLSEIVRPGETVCVIISDVTRRWQSPETYIPILIEELNACGVRDEDILILCATGTHRRQTKEEHIGLITEEIYNRVRIEDHVCTDKENMTYLGTTSYGTEVWLNKLAMDCDRLILTGGVVYHFLAGFGGGRKSILPGIAWYDTIMHNHNLALNEGLGSGSNPQVCSANMSGTNPFHADIMEAAAMAEPDFLLNVVADENHKIIGAFAGSWKTAHEEACRLVDAIDGVYVKERLPLVIASAGGYPKDLNLYQTSKTLANALAMVKEGGTMILLSACTEGIGDADCEHILCDFDTMEAREKELREHFSIGAYVGFMFAENAEKYHLILVTELPKETFVKSRVHAAGTLGEAMEIAKALNGGGLSVDTAVMTHGAQTLPKYRQ